MCVCLCVYTCIYTYKHIHIHTHTHIHVCMWIFAPAVSIGWAQLCRSAGTDTPVWGCLCPLPSPRHGSYLGMLAGFITFHVLVGYGGILVGNENCTKSCFIFMTFCFHPQPPSSSQFYIKEENLTLTNLQAAYHPGTWSWSLTSIGLA